MNTLKIATMMLLPVISGGVPDYGIPDSPDLHIWRGEYERILYGETVSSIIDTAAALTMARDFDNAVRHVSEFSDPFRKGYLYYKAGLYENVLEVEDVRLTNPYLEMHRLYYRSSSLLKTGNHEEALTELARLYELGALETMLYGDPIYIEGLNLYVSLWVEYAADSMRILEDPSVHKILTGRSLFLLADRYLRLGMSDMAYDFLVAGSKKPFYDVTPDLFKYLISRFPTGTDGFNKTRLMNLADNVLSAGNVDAAKAVIGIIREKKLPEDHAVKMLEADLAAMENRNLLALKMYGDIFESDAPTAARRDALLKMASQQYSLNLHERSASSYKLFGAYYPDDPRSSMALDRAARIEVSMADLDGALETWGKLSARNGDDRYSQEAALSESVLRYYKGDSVASYSILTELRPRAYKGIESAVIYWLFRTSPTEKERAEWAAELETRFPFSFYTRISCEGLGSAMLNVNNIGGKTKGSTIEEEELREISIIEKLERIGGSHYRIRENPAYRAFEYLTEVGFMTEADGCGDVLRDIYRGDDASLFTLYIEARSCGMVGLALRVLGDMDSFVGYSAIPRRLLYPIAYTGVVREQSDIRDLPIEMILAMIREESSFRRNAVSSAGAVGLMQLMPSTGLWIGRNLGVKNMKKELLYDPEVNVETRTWYIRHLLNRCQGSTVAALAAYNAGLSRMRGWNDSFDPAFNPMVAIEMIGIRETRGYVRKVMNSMSAYRYLAEAIEDHR